jgi:hypothetical protein
MLMAFENGGGEEDIWAQEGRGNTGVQETEIQGLDACALLGYYATLSASSVPTFRDNLSGPSSRIMKLDFLTLEDGTDTLSRNVGTQLPLNAA